MLLKQLKSIIVNLSDDKKRKAITYQKRPAVQIKKMATLT